MKIGIISINAHTKVLNFASPLHSYVFQQFLLSNGIESTIIDYKPVYYGKCDPKYPLFYQIDHPNADAAKQRRLEVKWRRLFWDRAERFDKIQNFIDTNYIQTEKCYSAKLLDEEDLGYDCYICATDVIWKWNPNNGFDRGFMLACKTMDGKGKIAYAASRGANGYTDAQGNIFKKCVDDMDYISVREKSLKEYTESVTEKQVTHVLDPVFLMPQSFYNGISKEPEEKGYVLIYIVMEKAKSLVTTAVNFAKEHNLKVIELSEDLENRKIPAGTEHEVIYNIGVEEWLGYMKNAEYIFTNSFHACCFSMIFQKQFWAGERSGDKIDSVLELFGLSDRRVSKEQEDGKFVVNPIDYERVNKYMEEYVADSKKFILDAIAGVEQKVRSGEIPRKITAENHIEEEIAQVLKEENSAAQVVKESGTEQAKDSNGTASDVKESTPTQAVQESGTEETLKTKLKKIFFHKA